VPRRPFDEEVTVVEIPASVKTYVDAFSRRDVDACFDTFAPDGTYSDPGTAQPLSGQASKEHFAGFFAGFPDATCETVGLDPISKDLWAWRWILHGTNTGSYRGLPPTGRSVVLPGCEFIEVRGDKVHRVEGYFDRLTLLGQLGLAPSPPARPAT
jgi:steroid delta-isomerase-like uncharacterized protein